MESSLIADIIIGLDFFEFKQVYILLEKNTNKRIDRGYMTMLTVSFMVFLKTIREEDDRREKITRYLDTLQEQLHLIF